MKFNFKKICAGIVSAAMLGTMTASVFAQDEPAVPADPNVYSYGTEDSDAVVRTSVSINFDEDGTIKDGEGNIIGNINDMPSFQASEEVDDNVVFTVAAKDTEALADGDEADNNKVAVTVSAKDGAEADEMKFSLIMIDESGNILDEERNIIGNAKDYQENGAVGDAVDAEAAASFSSSL